MNDTDILLQTINVLSEALPGTWVADQLPPAKDMDDNLPCVIVDILPGATKSTAWGGDGFPVRLDEVGLDIEVFAQSRGQATPLAEKVRALLYQLPHIAGTDVTAVDCPVFATREDLNPRVKVLGAEASLDKHS
ncbi:MAG: hypothetical protein ACI38U_14325 [Corynebacterium sp.]|jgi:hypothetical protein|uniref:hypothetical protein n=1 Tax=Corynebacterium sp. TaxID=1720 RepID=UPI003F127426